MASWKSLLAGLVVLGAVGGGAFWVITKPAPLPEATFANAGAPDLKNGERIFWAGGCISCHGAKGAAESGQLVLSGGAPLTTPFGTFYPPNISPDEGAGIGGWSLADFGNAMLRGADDENQHLYPAFPYGSYARMTVKDVNDLYGFLRTLPKSAVESPEQALNFPFSIRRLIGGWKFLYLNDKPRVELAAADDEVKRGQYLVEGPGHCGECHTPRDAIGGFRSGQWLAGGPNPEGKGKIPNITPGGELGQWSKDDIVSYLETGITPDADSVGGSMVEVQKNMARLPPEDRMAIAAYLKAIPPVK
nr:cytochrome c [uncultured Gellertiella sp.]